MQVFIRKNAIVCSGTFTAADGSTTQPGNAAAVLNYKNTAGVTTTDTVPLTVDASGVWSGTWDSSQAQAGVVDWMIHCWNGLTAATEGQFQIIANKANVS